MIRLFFVFVLCMVSLSAQASKKEATDFINEIKISADNDSPTTSSINIICPVKGASGRIMVSLASYEINKSKGGFVFKDNLEAVDLVFIAPLYPNDDDTKNLNGLEFGFKMPSGQFFVSILKSGKVKAGVNKNGTSGITEIACKIDNT